MKTIKMIIIGGSCSGKSTFARNLNEHLNVNLVHLDKLYWEENWNPVAEDKFQKRIEDITKENANWIIEGDYASSLLKRIEISNIIVYLDTNILLCIIRYIKRCTIYRNKREDITQGCIEGFKLSFLKHIILNHYTTKKILEEYIGAGNKGQKVFFLKNDKDNTSILNYTRTK